MSLAIRAGRLIDGTGAAPVEHPLVLVEGGRIGAVLTGPAAEVPAGWEEIDATGYTLLPGLIDAHLHLQGSGDPRDSSFGARAATQSAAVVAMNCYRNALKDLEAGFTTVRDAACREYADIAVRDAINAGDLVGPRIWACGLGITSTSGHMDREKYLAPSVKLPGPSAVADSPDEARRAVRQNLRYDVDFIKFNATLTEHIRRYRGYCAPEMTRETMAALIEEAHWHGRRVTAHCHGGDGATWAIESGIDGIEHGNFLSDEQLDMMAERGTVLCPTLCVHETYRKHGAKSLSPGQPHLEAWKQKALAHAFDVVRHARARGVKIICGTDAAMPYVRHGENAVELELLVEAGLTPMEALVAATGGAAEALAIADVGTVAPGMHADLVLVDGDPLADIRILQDLRRIPLVIKGGQIVADRRPAGSARRTVAPMPLVATAD